MRILVTGSRDWEDREAILMAFREYVGQHNVLVSGACPTGADRMAEEIAGDFLGWDVELHPADWQTYGKSAGFRRNKEMVDLGADICLAFIKNGSKGASMTARLAEEAGIEVRRFVVDEEV